LGHPPRLPGNKPPYQHTSAAKQEKNQTNAQLAGQIKKSEKIEKAAKCKDKKRFLSKNNLSKSRATVKQKGFLFWNYCRVIAEFCRVVAEQRQNYCRTVTKCKLTI